MALLLGARAAQSWADAIAKPPASLRAKLGLGDDSPALVIGQTADAALREAIDGTTITDGAQARMMIAIINGADDLAATQRVHAGFPALPLWVVYPKGREVAFGDAAIRAVLRSAGFRDTKSSAVSDRLAATRYNR